MKKTWILGPCVLLLAGPLAAQTTSLGAAGDTYLKSGSPNKSQGNEPALRVQSSGNNRSLVRFDQAAIAAAVGSGSLAAASLELFIEDNADNWGSDGRTVDAHRLSVAWTEAGATWNCPVDANPGNSSPDCAVQWAGGGFEEEPSDTVLHTNGLGGWVSFDVTADVQGYLAGAANHGWLVKKTEEGQNGRVDYTSRQGAAGQAPRLVLVVESAAFDEVPPSVAVTAPTQSVVVNDPTPEIVVEYEDGGGGVDLGSLLVEVDGVDQTSSCTVGPAAAVCEPPALAGGSHTVTARVADLAGNVAQASRGFELLLGPGMASATVAIVADTYLRQGQPNQNQGSEGVLRVRQSGKNRALLRVDPAEIASLVAGGTVLSARLELFIDENGDNWGGDGRTVDLHRLTASWSEHGATWSCAADADPGDQQAACDPQWNGGSFEAAPVGTVLVTNGLEGAMDFDVTADVVAMAGGGAHHGWLLKKTAEGQSGRVDVGSREAAADLAPQLLVTFELPGEGEDRVPPRIFPESPPDGSCRSDGLPRVGASFTDHESGIDRASVRLTVDGHDRTPESEMTDSGIDYVPAEALSEGLHEMELSMTDVAGNPATASWSFTVDSVPPALVLIDPQSEVLEPTPTINLELADSGLVTETLSVTIDGTDVTATCTTVEAGVTCDSPVLEHGIHEVAASVADCAGNVAMDFRYFSVLLDLNPPSVSILSPVAGDVVVDRLVTVEGSVEDDGEIIALRVNREPIAAGSGPFTATVELEDGESEVEVTAVDRAGRAGSATVRVTVDTIPPALTLTAPSQGQLVNAATVRVAGEVKDVNGIAFVSVDGTVVPLTDSAFESSLFETEVAVHGARTITVVAEDAAGNRSEQTRDVTGFKLPEVLITSPEDLSSLAATTTAVAGRVSDEVTSVTVNGVAANLQGTSFLAEGVPLIEGGNVVTASATDLDGHVATATIHVVRDLTAPRVAIYRPAPGSTVYEPTVSVSGLVNDIVPGTVNASEATVTVNGVPAEVVNRSFFAEGIALVPGDNTLIAVAVDAGGNVAEDRVTVRLEAGPVARVRIVSGDHQTARIGTPLPEPLVVELVSAAGLPVAGKPTVFRLKGNDGKLDGGRRRIVVVSDASGRAQSHFTPGNRAGVANQVVEVSAAGFAGPAVFTASALPGEPASIVVDSGGLQVGVTGRRVPRPLIAAVIDSGHNRLEGVPVLFRVVRGLGTFADGSQETVLTTDSDGRAVVAFTLDPEEGIANNVVEALLQGDDDTPVATFVASGRAAGDPTATSISGVVLDNTNLPLEGVTLRVKGTALTAQSDGEGQFRIPAAPVGSVKLIVDGSTVNRPGSWPDLEFDLVTIAGRDNTVNMPIYLLPLDLANGVYVDETHGGVLTLPQIPGFALEIAPGSMSFPGGGKSGLVSVTVVHNDRVPMVPNFGQQPRLIVTIQPAGARFEPPARLTLPNVEGLAPGEVTEMYSFDHDLGHFVSIGPATVSDDGTVIRSDPGVGLVKAGWHCGGNPASSGTPHDCPQCKICNGSLCVPGCAVPAQLGSALPLDLKAGCGCSDRNECTNDDDCQPGGGCKGKEISVDSVDASVNGKKRAVIARGDSATFTATAQTKNCHDVKYTWRFSDGQTMTGMTVTRTFDQKGVIVATVEVKCDACITKKKADTVRLVVVKLEKVDVIAGATQDHLKPGKNWAAVKGMGGVVIQAVVDPPEPEADQLLVWSGGNVQNAPFLRFVNRDQTGHTEVTATLGLDSDSVDIWVLWAEVRLQKTGNMTGLITPPGEVGGPSGERIELAFPLLGELTDEDNWDDGFRGAETSAHVEIIGRILPASASQIFDSDSGWSFKQWVSAATCSNGALGAVTQDQEDDPGDDRQDVEPSPSDEISYIDAPTVGIGFQADRTIERYRVFLVRATWSNKDASDDFRWSYFVRVDDDLDALNKPRNQDTLLNEVQPNDRQIPAGCYFVAR